MVVLATFAQAETFEALVAAHDAAVAKWNADYQAGKVDDKSYPGLEYIPKMTALAEELAGKPEALDPLLWLLSNACSLDTTHTGKSRPIYEWTIAAIEKNHLDSPRIWSNVSNFWYFAYMTDPAPLAGFHETLIKHAPDEPTRGAARLALARVLSTESIFHPPADRERAIRELKQVVADGSGTKTATAAEQLLFDLEKLQVGMPAPEIAGKSPDGAEIKLSQYLGQVVVLDFWGYL